jgi:hypothetical protein
LLTPDGLSHFVDNLPLDELNLDIWSKSIDRLKGHSTEDLRFRRFRIAPIEFSSTILTTIPTIFEEFQIQNWQLLYRGTVDGFSSSAFHRKCDRSVNTITIILTTKSFIFGGFTPIEWDSSSGYKHDSSQKSFLFTMKNPRNSVPRKFGMSSSSNAIYCSGSYGPRFGSGNDIVVFNGCNANNSSYTNLGGAYVNDTGIAGYQVFTGEQHFTVKEIEVFTITI